MPGVADKAIRLAAQAWEFLRPMIGPVPDFVTRPLRVRGREFNPFRLDACYWGDRDPRFVQGITWAFILHILLFASFLLAFIGFGCSWKDEMPSGGGSKAVMAVPVVIKKKPQRKKWVVNPLNPIKFEVKEFEKETELKIQQQITAMVAHVYATGMMGSGKGEGAGVSSGTGKGVVNLYRLKYDGGDWDQDMGRGADYNMLLEFRIRSGWKIANEIKVLTCRDLDNSRKFWSPPFVYMTGEKRIDFSQVEVAMLRRYLLEKHGMLFADNGGSGKWGKEFRVLMSRVLPEVKPVYIPMDDEIMTGPYTLPSFPHVAPHDPPMKPTGWKYQGRWVCFYHPGDIGDAWKDGHAGVNADVAEMCYQLGTNIIFYAYNNYNLWKEANSGGAKP